MNGDRPVETPLSDLISKALTVMREGSFSMDLCSSMEAHHFPPDVVKAIGDRFPHIPDTLIDRKRKFKTGDVVKLAGSYTKLTVEAHVTGQGAAYGINYGDVEYYQVVWFDARHQLLRATLPDVVLHLVPEKKSRVSRYSDDDDA